MTELRLQQCHSLTASEDRVLNDEEVANFLQQLAPQWQLDEEEATLSQTFKFKNYYQTIAFVNVVAQIAHQQDHHPDLQVSYNRCTIVYSTHSVGGLSIKDFICAAKINAAIDL